MIEEELKGTHFLVRRFPLNFVLGLCLIFTIVVAFWSFAKDGIVIRAEGAQGSLSLSSSSIVYQVGQIFREDINLDTGGAEIKEVNIQFLEFDPNLLDVLDSDLETAEIEIEPGDLTNFEVNKNLVLNDQGKIEFQIVAQPEQGFVGISRVATILFRSKSEGKAELKFDFTAGLSEGSTIIAKNDSSNILTSAPNSLINIGVLSEQDWRTPRSEPSSEISPTSDFGLTISPSPTIEISPSKTPTPLNGLSTVTNYRIASLAITPKNMWLIYLFVPVVLTLIIFIIWTFRRRKTLKNPLLIKSLQPVKQKNITKTINTTNNNPAIEKGDPDEFL